MKIRSLIIMLVFSAVFAKEFFYVDYSSFRTLENDITRTDIYISIPIAHLEFNKDLESIFAVRLYIIKDGRVIAEDKWKQKYKISSPDQKYSGAEVPTISKAALAPGYYGLKVEVEDLVSGKVIDVLEVPQGSEKFMVADFPEGMSMSTIQLASRIITENVDEGSEFFRQGAIILPNPSKIFGTSRPSIFYYTELYGISEGDDIDYSWRIASSEGEEMMKGEVNNRKSPGTSIALVDRILVPRLKTGSYDLYLTITNKTTGKTIEAVNNFYTFRQIDFDKKQRVLPEGMSVSARDSVELDIMKDDEIKTEFEQVYSTLDKKEQSNYAGLNTTGKREFLKRFWTEKEKSRPDARENFRSLLRVVQNEFSNKKTEGWKTDRGAVYLKMGPPSRRDVETFNNEYYDHEIWTYFEGNYTFVFADMHGFGEFKLIHSDYPGEKNDPNWKNKIKKSRF